ncbi:MAG: hypothetical protein Unbinned338contig1000_3 [Prokaryotic dsDNA virus sp.]|nr:MAG: hypothetical protein Unbinned338contig1000_3 [Prokaryotic dsDNA virus sp.]|tara:strand:- start:1415 stop:1588 length:174 start_codon:yes stop_codon:yes gene_type:complete
MTQARPTHRLSAATVSKAIRAARSEGGCVVEVRDDVIRIVPVEAERQAVNPADLVNI